jgi:Ca2+-binding RTX toxin-like protein
MKASTGNTTLIGGDPNTAGYLGTESLVGGPAADTFIFGSGSETITGGGGANQFTDLNKQTAGTTISLTDFVSGGASKVDLFSLTNASLTGATANMSAQTHSGGDTFVILTDGVTIRFAGAANVAATDFVTNVGTVQVGKVV